MSTLLRIGPKKLRPIGRLVIIVAIPAIGICLSMTRSGAPSEWFDRMFSRVEPVEPFGAYADGVLPPASDNADGEWTLEVAYPDLAFDSPMALAAEPGSDRLWVAERAGQIWHFTDDDDCGERTLALDIRSRTWDGVDSGLLDFAFHPRFQDGRRWLFATYIAGTESQPDDRRFRLARFVVGADGRIDAGGETILIDQLASVDQHRGGSLAFGGDGMLYVGVGDLGSPSRVQRLRQGFRGCVLRLDVDQDPERSESLGDRLVDRGDGLWTGAYGIPHDNPRWQPEDRRHLPEYYAAGLRNPHRLAVDPRSGVMLAADVGANQGSSREELNRIVAGGNYGWPFREGGDWLEPQPGVIVGKLTDALYHYGHEEGDRCVIGGVFYRSERWLSLRGHYVYGDYSSGRCWAQRWTGKELATDRIALGRLKGVVGFGTTSRGEVICLSLIEKHLRRVVPNDRRQRRPLPARLSETGLLTLDDEGGLRPHPGLVEYSIANPAWHDGAEVRRWIGVPTNGWRNFRSERIAVAADGDSEPLELPDGSVVVKHLAFVDAESDSSETAHRHIETQIIVRGPDGHYGAAYRWNDAQTDAELVTEGLLRTIVRHGADTGIVEEQPWTHHGVQTCAACHREQDGYLLGLDLRQLAVPAPGRTALTQLGQWQGTSLLQSRRSEELLSLAHEPAIDDVEAPADLRVRAWLDINCSHCHQNDRSNRTSFDLRYARSGDWFDELTAMPSVLDPLGRRPLIVAGRPADSMFWQRIRSTSGDAMPPLGRHLADQRMVDLLGEVIAARAPIVEATRGLADGGSQTP